MKLLLLSLTVLTFLCHCAAPSGASSGNAAALAATKDQPFVNSLGMKFVPVPGTNILMCTTETTVAQYRAAGMRNDMHASGFPKFSQGPNHPVVYVSWDGAKAWCDWLSRKEGRKYRLPTDAEWSAAVGGTPYPWGNQWPPPNNCGNYKGQEWRNSELGLKWAKEEQYAGQLTPDGKVRVSLISGFQDRHVFTAPVGSYPANNLGIYDLGGNVSEWCEDKKSVTMGRGNHMWRGGNWGGGAGATSDRQCLLSSLRFAFPGHYDGDDYGFRCVVVR